MSAVVGSIEVRLLVQVGRSEPVEFGTMSLPVTYGQDAPGEFPEQPLAVPPGPALADALEEAAREVRASAAETT